MSATFKDHFSGFAGRYADFRPQYPAELFDYLATLVPARSTVWDCAAGNGQATVGLAKRFSKIIATDASQEQIDSAPKINNVDFRVASAEQNGLSDQSIDLVTVAQAVHWFDLGRFFAEVDRVLKPCGVLAVWAYGINQIEGDQVNQIVQHFYSEIVGPYWPPERRLIEEGYRSIQLPFAEITSPEFRMETHWTLEQLLGYFGTWSATNRYIKSVGKNPIDPLREELKAHWPDDNSPRSVVWPLTVRIGRKPRSGTET